MRFEDSTKENHRVRHVFVGKQTLKLASVYFITASIDGNDLKDSPVTLVVQPGPASASHSTWRLNNNLSVYIAGIPVLWESHRKG
eukprot:TRINITY_DN4446_c0_g1_i1.p1 TRINITY_DN4446_c0_g1~~TRINITY_DN4446_c0_g1_i1.p1  ORF type:complete len:85 (+),score=12.10 TRINITY_DN4446_c0_g1_i1:220-474(+)